EVSAPRLGQVTGNLLDFWFGQHRRIEAKNIESSLLRVLLSCQSPSDLFVAGSQRFQLARKSLRLLLDLILLHLEVDQLSCAAQPLIRCGNPEEGAQDDDRAVGVLLTKMRSDCCSRIGDSRVLLVQGVVNDEPCSSRQARS